MLTTQRSNKYLTIKSLILKEDQKLNYNNPISPPGKGRGKLEITDVNNHYIDQGRMGYKVLDGYWSDAGTFESLLRAGMIVKKHREKKEGTTDERK
jgi:dTDP-glucose pyrophosphorylase